MTLSLHGGDRDRVKRGRVTSSVVAGLGSWGGGGCGRWRPAGDLGGLSGQVGEWEPGEKERDDPETPRKVAMSQPKEKPKIDKENDKE